MRIEFKFWCVNALGINSLVFWSVSVIVKSWNFLFFLLILRSSIHMQGSALYNTLFVTLNYKVRI